MSSIVWALYDTRGEAERAVRSVTAEVPLRHAGVYDASPASLEALRRLDLSPNDLAACERKLSAHEHLLLVRAKTADDIDRIIAVLESGPAPETPQSRPGTLTAQETLAPGSAVIEEERGALIEEELRVGAPEVVRGGARVRTHVEEIPHTRDVELLEEILLVDKRPANRRIDEQELQSAGLMRGRVVEIAQMREEAVVTKQAFVREEVVVRKTVERRVEQVHETLRKSELEAEDFATGASHERRTSSFE
ncbi:MAG TPA: YsnF/AvaK domain-containing protein [Brevundimonas sp.]|nr:YsnF/AvaK domain-containing protein [Brevundimonas sp.]